MTKKRLLIGIAVVLTAVFLSSVLYFHEPLKTWWLPKCFFHELSSLHCPGCGATRAMYALLHGNILLSLRNNLMMIPMLITALVISIKPQWGLKRQVAYPVAIIAILFFILRNLPFYPFTLLQPLS